MDYLVAYDSSISLLGIEYVDRVTKEAEISGIITVRGRNGRGSEGRAIHSEDIVNCEAGNYYPLM